MCEKLKTYWQNEKKNILFCFAATFILGLAAHAYVMFNNDMSHDWLNAFVATDVENITKIRVGRYIVPLYRAIFRNSIALPWLIGFLSLLWYSASSYLITRIFDIKSRMISFLISGIVVTNITVTAQLATYLHEADLNAFALLLSVAAAYIWKKHTKLYQLIPSAVLLFISMGIYQSYVCVAITLIICVSLFDLIEEKNIKIVIKRGINGICVIIVGFFIYNCIASTIYTVAGLEPETRVNALRLFSENYNIFYILYQTFISFFNTLLHSSYDRDTISILLTALISSSFLLFVYVAIRNKFSFLRFSLIIFLFTSLPFSMNAISIISYGLPIHELMLYSIWFTWIIAPILIYKLSKNDLPSFIKISSRNIVIAIILCLTWQNIIISNTAYMKKNIVAQSSLSTMTRVLDRIEQHPDYISGETQIAFIGVPSKNALQSPYSEIYDFNHMCSFTCGNLNDVFSHDTMSEEYSSYRTYFKYVLNSSAIFCDNETHSQLKQNKEVQEMPIFPAKDSLKIIDGILVIRLGK